MTAKYTRSLESHEVPAENWLTPVAEPNSPAVLAEVQWLVDEALLRRVARREGILIERLSPDRYRLWDLRAQIRGLDYPVPVDLTAMGEYVDSLAGIACFISLVISPGF
jgi:hypothetical protein